MQMNRNNGKIKKISDISNMKFVLLFQLIPC